MKNIGWVDLTIENAEVTRDFYSDVMGWRPEPLDMGGYADYVMTDPATGDGLAGVCHARGVNAGIPPVWLVYFRVESVEKSMAAIVARGGEVLQGPRPAGGGRFVVARDPAGAVFAIAEGGDDAADSA